MGRCTPDHTLAVEDIGCWGIVAQGKPVEAVGSLAVDRLAVEDRLVWVEVPRTAVAVQSAVLWSDLAARQSNDHCILYH